MVENDIHYKLIMEIEKRPMLYNCNLPEYSNKVLIEKTWKEIARKYGFTIPETKEKWRNIRSTFVRSLKPSKDSKPKKPYYLSGYLGFVVPFLKGHTGEHIEKERSHGSIQDSDQENSIDDDNDVENALSSSPSSEVPLVPITNLKRRLSEVEDEDQLDTFLHNRERRIDPNDTYSPTSSASDSVKYFFQSLMGEFDSMTESQIRGFKIGVLQLIDQIKSNHGHPSPRPSVPPSLASRLSLPAEMYQ